MVKVAEEVVVARLSELVDRAIEGEVVVITRDGKPVATLHPAADIAEQEVERHDVETNREAFRRLREYARQHPVPNITREEIRDWIEEGRP
jgi:prevent-host-death family protein